MTIEENLTQESTPFYRNWRDLITPNPLEVDQESHTESYGKFVCQPLERGFATTIGNGLRRKPNAIKHAGFKALELRTPGINMCDHIVCRRSNCLRHFAENAVRYLGWNTNKFDPDGNTHALDQVITIGEKFPAMAA